MAEKIDASTFSSYDSIMEYVKKRRNFYIKPEYNYIIENKDFYRRKFYPLRTSSNPEKHKKIIYDVFGNNSEILEKIIYLQKKYKLTPIEAISLFIRGDFSAENTRCELSREKTELYNLIDGWTICSKLKYTKMIPYFYDAFKEKTRIISRKIFRDMKTLRFGTSDIEEVFYIYKNNFVIDNKCTRCGGITKFKDIFSGYKKYCENCINNYIKPNILKKDRKGPKSVKESLILAGIDVKERNKKNHELYLKIRKNIPFLMELRKKYGLKNTQIIWHIENNDPDFQIGKCKICGDRKHFSGYFKNYDFSDIKNEYGCFCPKYNRKNIYLTTKNFYINRFSNINEEKLTRKNFLNTKNFLSLIKKGYDPIEDLLKKENIKKIINEKNNNNLFQVDDVTNDLLYNKFLAYNMYVQKCMTTIEIAEFMNISEKRIINSLKKHQFYIGRSVLNRVEAIKNKLAVVFYDQKPEDFKVLRYLISIGERYVENLIHIKNFKHREIPLIFFIEFFNDLLDINDEKTYLDNGNTEPFLIL